MKQFPIITEITPDVLHGAMDQHAENIASAFADWIRDSDYMPIMGRDRWVKKAGGVLLTTKELYKSFTNEIICKNVNQAASANSIQNQETPL